jgi:RNA polymerase sigma factor (sigma-70 family)
VVSQPSSRLFRGASGGEQSGMSRLVDHCLAPLRSWAHGRLPRWTRAAADTSDIVQDVWLRTLGRLDAFEPQGRHALAAYLRKAVRNRISDEHRRFARSPTPSAALDAIADSAPSPFDQAVAAETEARYRAALARLTRADREIIVAHVELNYTHEQLGCMTGRSPNAARMALRRAVGRLAESMRER